MASLRGSQQIWNAKSVSTVDSTHGKSALCAVGPGPYVAIYINNAGSASATFKVQAAVGKPMAGLNGLDSTEDGGLTWYDYTNATGIVVAASATDCFDLSPYGPEYIRLVRTDGGSATTITAWVSSFGPN